MRLLLDTHIAIWAAIEPGELTAAERCWMAEGTNRFVLSVASVWELRVKWHSVHVSGEGDGIVGPAPIVAFAGAMIGSSRR